MSNSDKKNWKDSWYFCIKRIFDIVFSLCIIVVAFVPSLLIALCIYIDDPHGSPLFTQKRVGVNGKEFTMYKFRTMFANAEEQKKDYMSENEKDGPVFKIINDKRITRFGKILRKTSIDELPQFINILLGDMSVVGPRPALPQEVAAYTDAQKRRLEAIPGLTCEWQIQKDRDLIPFEKWVEMDCEYIQKKSLLNDLRIIALTAVAVFGAYGS